MLRRQRASGVCPCVQENISTRRNQNIILTSRIIDLKMNLCQPHGNDRNHGPE